MTKKKQNSKKAWVIGGGAIILVGGMFVAPMLLASKGPILEEVKPSVKTLETYYTFSGTVQSENQEQVRSEGNIQISTVNVEEGERVEKGDTLFETSQGTKVKAKVSGTVAKIYVSEDESVAPGTMLCDVVDFNTLQVATKVDEYNATSMKENDNVTVTIEATDEVITGKVEDLSDIATNENGVAYFTATIDLPKSKSTKIGFTAEVKKLNERAENALVIPMEAVQFDDEGKTFVQIKNKKGEPVHKEITTGVNDGKYVEIQSGITKDDVIVYPDPDAPTTNGMPGFLPPTPGM